MQAEQYIATRQQTLKASLREKRKAAGYTQQAVADALSCARTRIVEIEDPDSSVFYSVGEVELLAWLFGINPLELLRGSGPDFIALGHFVSDQQTKGTLLSTVDCALPQSVAEFYATSEYSPAFVKFSPSGGVVATIVDEGEAESWDEDWEEGPYQYTLFCWDARTGALLGERGMPYVEHLALLDDARIAIATARPTQKFDDARDYVGENRLLIWNVRTHTIEQEIEPLDRTGALAVSTDGGFLAAYFPATTTIQCWRTTNWTPVLAVELETLKGDLDSIGSMYRTTDEVRKLPRKRKFDSWLSEHHATRFEFIDEHSLVIGFGRKMCEYDLLSPSAKPPFEIEHPVIPWSALTHVRDARREIAVKDLDYDHQLGESRVELWYLGWGKKSTRPDTSYHFMRRYSGVVHVPTIIDDACVLAPVEYHTAYPVGRSFKSRLGLCNIVSGRVVMLEDNGRLSDEDDQAMARISPHGDAIAYWVFPREGLPRLTIQYISDAALRVKGLTLARGSA